MANSGARIDEIRFLIRDEETECYVLYTALGDSPLGVQGWHFKSFPCHDTNRGHPNVGVQWNGVANVVAAEGPMNGGYSPLRREVRALNRKCFEDCIRMLETRMVIAELTHHTEEAIAMLKGVSGMKQDVPELLSDKVRK